MKEAFEKADLQDKQLQLGRLESITSELTAPYLGEIVKQGGPLRGPAFVALSQIEGGDKVVEALPEDILLSALSNALPIFGWKWYYSKPVIIGTLSLHREKVLEVARNLAPTLIREGRGVEPILDIIAMFGGWDEIRSLVTLLPSLNVTNQVNVVRAAISFWSNNRSEANDAELNKTLLVCLSLVHFSRAVQEVAKGLGRVGGQSEIPPLEARLSSVTPITAGRILKAIDDIRRRNSPPSAR